MEIITTTKVGNSDLSANIVIARMFNGNVRGCAVFESKKEPGLFCLIVRESHGKNQVFLYQYRTRNKTQANRLVNGFFGNRKRCLVDLDGTMN